MTARNEDFLFAQEAQSLGYVSEEQVEEGFLLQRKMAEDLKIDERLAVILVKRGWLAEEQARRVYGIIEPEGARNEIEGYRLVEKIGRGAMGTVYKAIHKGLHRVVAIKILRRDLAADKTQIERLKREAKLLADLDHPNVVRAFDAGESNGYPFLVMEYVEGETLRDRIAKRGAFSDEEALRITRALADALEKARRMGVVHRDVKPGNVLMSKSGTPKLMDLGLAKGPLDLGLTQHGATVGTPQFISPEQAQDPRKADTRSDIYSLGATLYAMLTTRPPFEGATLAEIITKVLYQQPMPPRMRNRDVSPEVAHLVERMMLKDPSLRYQTPAQVVADVDMIRGGQSIVPKGFTGNWEAYLLRQRQRKWIRRGVIGLAAAIVLGIGAYEWYSTVQRDRAQAEVEDLAGQVLALPTVTDTSTAEEIAGWAAEARRLKDEIDRCEREKGVTCGRKDEVALQLRRYGATLAALRALENDRRSLAAHENRGEFKQALERLDLHKERVRGYPPAEALHGRLIAGVVRSSNTGWTQRLKAARDKTARDLDEFLANWNAYRAALDGHYVETKEWRLAVRQADKLATAAKRIHDEVRRLREDFSGEALARRIAAYEFYELRTDLTARRHSVVSAVEGHWEAFRQEPVANVPRALLTGENGYVQLALAEVRQAVDQQVEAFVQSVLVDVQTMDVDAALDRLQGLEGKLARGSYYLALAKRVADRHDAMDTERQRRVRAAEAAYATARAAVLAALRRGDADGMRRAVGEALAHPDLDHKRRTDVEALRVAADALDELHAAAVAYLKRAQAKGERLPDVARRSGDGTVVVDKRWSEIEVFEADSTIRARVQRQGSRPETIRVALRDITLPQLRAWANRVGQALSDRTQALIELALLEPVHDEPGKDLRKLIVQYQRVRARFERLDVDSAYATVVRQLVARLDGHQRNREDTAERLWSSVQLMLFHEKPKYVPGLELLELLTSEKGKHRYTDVFDLNREEIERLMKVCHHEIAQEELLRMVPGALVDALPGERHRFLFDMDDEIQLRNFDRGFGEREAHGGAVTPRGPSDHRLHLLKGIEGILRDRPLSMRSMFDPHERIVLEITLWTLEGSFLVAFDIDGVQVAICSADPNIWKWRLHPKAPLVEDETALPEFDYYGRGRGIAFHAGKDFGGMFPLGNWDWPAFGAGRHFERWRDEDFLRQRRASLFAFEPLRKYQVKVVRERGKLELWVDGERIAQRHKSEWEERGAASELNRRVRHGSGRLQILTWTPMAIDDLRIEGRVRAEWRRLQKMRLEEEQRRADEAKTRAKEEAEGK